MSKEEILLDLISKVLTREYVLDEVRRSNTKSMREYDFVIKKSPARRLLTAKILENLVNYLPLCN